MRRGFKVAAASVALLQAIGSGLAASDARSQPADRTAPAPAADRVCAAALADSISAAADLTFSLAEHHAAATNPAGRPVPAHCELIGAFDRHAGIDGQAYAIRFHLRLPDAWNGRFFFQGGGGSDGVLGDALGDLQGGRPETALRLGYAVVSQDAGHDNQTNNVAAHGGTVSFGWNPRAREDYAYRSQARVTEVAKALVARYYGMAPSFSYWVGCSKGGQEGLALAQRYPAYFDGMVTDAPGFALPKAAIAQAWDAQAMARAATSLGAIDTSGLPLINAALSPADLALAAGAIGDACDRLDGLADGVVGDFAACTTKRVRPELERLHCAGEKSANCLSGAQIAALIAVYDGARNHAGRPLYSDWAWDVGIAGAGWRAWKLGSADGRTNDGLGVMLGAPSLASVFTTPPTAVEATPAAQGRFILGFDFDRDAPKIFATNATYPQSAWALMNAQSDLAGFRARRGKAIIVQGVSDPVFSIRDTARWWDRVDHAMGGQAAQTVRLFPVPGMNHCRGGPGTTNFDAFSALVAWVEHGRAPDRIVATAPADTPWPGRTRPLCPYPTVPVYAGRGDVERAESFACRPGPRVQ